MINMWTIFLQVIFICFSVASAYRNENFKVPDVMDLLKSQSLQGLSEVCAEHMQMYLDGALGNKDWALDMFDSITKFPDGIRMGHISIPGHFDECVDAFNEEFSGKHCMLTLIIKQDTQNSKLLDIYNKPDKNNNRMVLSYGICIPSTCNSTDIKNAAKEFLPSFIEIDLNETQCSVSGYRPFRTEDWITVAVLIVISITAIGSTIYDLLQRFKNKNETPNQLWSSFSLYTNGKQLFSISQSTSQLKCLHGIRFLSMCWVILGHSYFSFLFGAPINSIQIPKYMNDRSFIPVSNAFVSVDSFFFLSGLLVCLIFFRDISRKKTFDVPVAYIHRYMRLTPPFAILLLIQSTIISRIGNGPFWNDRTDDTEKNCRESWWTGMLYVQNYLQPTAMCLGQAWYLSADMQMFWLSPLVLYPMLWFPSMAPYFLLLLTLAAAFTNFAIAFVNNLRPNLFINLSQNIMNQFELEYAPFHTRMAPWIIGVATGYIICGIQAKKIRLNIPKMWVAVGWIAAGFLLGGSLFGISRFISSEYTQAEASFYLAFHRVGWALGMAFVVIACVGGYGGPVNEFLSLDFFQPLGKLSYSNFLVHMTLQNYRVNSSRINQYLRHIDIVYSYFGDLLISNLISIPIVLLFEFPFTSIDRHFFQKLVIFPLPRVKSKTKKEECEKESEKTADIREDVEKGKVNPAFTE